MMAAAQAASGTKQNAVFRLIADTAFFFTRGSARAHQFVIAVTTYLPSLRVAVKRTLSPALILASSAGSAS